MGIPIQKEVEQMDEMLQAYMEETEELILKAEECIIRLEIEYSSVDVNELFRIAHTIKGSSHMVGYEDIGNLMHKIEDMLDYARNGSILFDQSIVQLCFEGIDTVKKMLISKREPESYEDITQLVNSAAINIEKIDSFIRVNKKEEEKVTALQSATGIVSSLLKVGPKGENKYYITFFIEENAPMVSTIFIMILNSIQEIGTLEYSSVSDDFFCVDSQDNDINILSIIISTDVEEADLYTFFTLFYVEKIDIINLNKRKNKQSDVSLTIKDRNLFRTFKPEKDGFIKELKSFIEFINLELIFMILIDTSQLTIIDENEIKELIEIKKQLKLQEVEMGIIVDSSNTKRIVNIFDAISSIEEFNVYENELDAVLNTLEQEEFFLKMSRVAKKVYHG
jgi:chemotaxis protein histidine kinase CheA